MRISDASQEQLQQLESQLNEQYQQLKGRGLKLDLTRGKPSAAQLDLSDGLDGILEGTYVSESGVDTRNYSDPMGIMESRQLGAALLEAPASNVLASGNSSLSLMFLTVMTQMQYGSHGPESAWNKLENPKFLCPVPGYDRHFSVCKKLGIDMVTVPMTETGPDMDQVEKMVAEDHSIVGMWCVPKYSNPTGCVYSDETVERMAALGKIASPNFRIFWDNAYSVHHLGDDSDVLASLWAAAEAASTLDNIWLFASGSKITFAGASIAWVASSDANMAAFNNLMGMITIGADKTNQLRHYKMLPDMAAVKQKMLGHADILRPKFDLVINSLETELGDEFGCWNNPKGGYFISFDSKPGLAKEIVALAADAGVKLTPAGATFPYGNDPEDCNIRLAPSFPPIEEVKETMEVFVCCVKLATVQKKLAT